MKRLFLAALLTAALFSQAGAGFFSGLRGGMPTGGGSVLTTATFVNAASVAAPAGQVKQIGQAFRRGDLPAGTYPVLRDAVSHVAIPVQQLDEIATRRENGDDGSIRHLVASYQLPPSSPQYTSGGIPANGTFQVEFFKTSGTYSASGVQTLAAYCAAHDIKIRITDVRNQDDTVRDSGAATFDTCANIANIGRDAPRHLWAGGAQDLYEVRGLFVYDTSGHSDPALYNVCDLYLTTAAGSSALASVKHVCRVDSPWMNVTSSSTGNSGAPGPIGFANDPQAISYRAEIFDGATSILSWNALDASIASASNPVTSSCYSGASTCWSIPGSSAGNSWYLGQAVRYSTTGTPPTGYTNNQLYFTYPYGTASTNGADPHTVFLYDNPSPGFAGTLVQPVGQGTGNQNFSTRIWHTHWMSWFALDATGEENWTVGNTAARTTWAWWPAYTNAEKLYWEQTGMIPPMLIGTSSTSVMPWGTGTSPYYNPLGRINVIGGSQGGPRPDLGIINEYAARAFLNGLTSDWSNARLFSLGATHYPYSNVLNEATGRIPAINNGSPTGAGGTGTGAAYSQLGAVFPDFNIFDGAGFVSNVVWPLQNVPLSGLDYIGAYWGPGTRGYGCDHEPSYGSLTYLMLGSRHYLDLIYIHGDRNLGTGFPGDRLDYRTDFENSNRYTAQYGYGGCQRRGEFWVKRDADLGAALGGDNATVNQERVYFGDVATENWNHENPVLAALDGASTNFRNALKPASSVNISDDSFVDSYGVITAYMAYTMLRDPQAHQWFQEWGPFYNAMCGETGTGHLSAFFCAGYSYTAALHDPGHPIAITLNIGQYYNGTDFTDFGQAPDYFSFTAGSGQVAQHVLTFPFLQVGDTIKCSYNIAINYGAAAGVDQLTPTTDWFRIIGPIDNTAGTFFIENPATPGVAFPSFTRSGTPLTDNLVYCAVRPQYAPSTGWYVAGSSSYAPYAANAIIAQHILGIYNVSPAYNMIATRGGVTYDTTYASQIWDPTVVVP